MSNPEQPAPTPATAADMELIVAVRDVTAVAVILGIPVDALSTTTSATANTINVRLRTAADVYRWAEAVNRPRSAVTIEPNPDIGVTQYSLETNHAGIAKKLSVRIYHIRYAPTTPEGTAP